jgi:ABC-type sugar transport system ATPase subunit
MDEPLSNLDAKLRESLRVELKHLQKTRGSTTLFVTHDQIEALTMADRIAVLREGRIVAIGSPRELLADATTVEIRFVRGGEEVVIATDEPTRVLNELTAEALADGVELEEIEVRRRTLEDVYLEVTREST